MTEHLEQIKATLNAVGIECDIIDADGKHVLACSKEVDGIKRSMRYKCSTCLWQNDYRSSSGTHKRNAVLCVSY